MGSENMSRAWRAVCLCLCFGMLPRSQATLPAEVLEKVKAATVYIVVNRNLQISSGSGFLISERSRSATDYVGIVVTNAHVVENVANIMDGRYPIQVVVGSGTRKQTSCNATLIAYCEEFDLAFLEITNRRPLPEPLALAPAAAVQETMPLYAFGYPFGSALAVGAKSPEVSVTQGILASVRRDREDVVEALQLDVSINPGNSGGPVVNRTGEVVGVVVAKVADTQIGFAIPLWRLALVRHGYAGIRAAYGDIGNEGVQVGVNVMAPTAALEKLELLVAAGDIPLPLRCGDDRGWQPIGGNPTVVPLAMQGRRLAVARCQSSDQGRLLLQVHGVRQDGTEFWSAPQRPAIRVESASPIRPDATVLPSQLDPRTESVTDATLSRFPVQCVQPPMVDPDKGTLLLATNHGGRGYLCVVGLGDWKVRQEVRLPSNIVDLGLSSEGLVTLHSGQCEQARVVVWDPETFAAKRQIPYGAAQALVCSPRSRYAAVRQKSEFLDLIDLTTGEITATLAAGDDIDYPTPPRHKVRPQGLYSIRHAAFSTSGEALFVADAAFVHRYRIVDGALVWADCTAPLDASLPRDLSMGVTGLVCRDGTLGVAVRASLAGKLLESTDPSHNLPSPAQGNRPDRYLEFPENDLADPSFTLGLAAGSGLVLRTANGLVTERVQRLDAKTGEILRQYSCDGTLVPIPDGRGVFIWRRGTLRLLQWDGGLGEKPVERNAHVAGRPRQIEDLTLTPILPFASELGPLAMAPDGSVLYVASRGTALRRIRLDDLVEDRMLTLADPIVELAAGTRWLAVVTHPAAREHILRSLDAESLEIRGDVEIGSTPPPSPGQMLASPSGCYVLLWPVPTRRDMPSRGCPLVDLATLRLVPDASEPQNQLRRHPPVTFLGEDQILSGTRIYQVSPEGVNPVQRCPLGISNYGSWAVSPDHGSVVWWGGAVTALAAERCGWKRPLVPRLGASREGLLLTRATFAADELACKLLDIAAVDKAVVDSVAGTVAVLSRPREGRPDAPEKVFTVLDRKLSVCAQWQLPLPGNVLQLAVIPRGYRFLVLTSEGLFHLELGAGQLGPQRP